MEVPFIDGSGHLAMLAAGDKLEVEWPCEEAGTADMQKIWFPVVVLEVRQGKRWPRYTLQFEDGGEAEHSLRDLRCRNLVQTPSVAVPDELSLEAQSAEVCHSTQVAAKDLAHEVLDSTGFVHEFELPDELLSFCDWLHAHREAYSDATRGNAAYGEALHGGLVSVLVRREALPQPQKDLFNELHHRCIQEVPIAWPGWLQKAGGKKARARPSQDLRLLQYSTGAAFKAHVDSGWACQGLVYLNEDFQGGQTSFPNLNAHYQPRRGRVLLWRSVSVGHKPSVPSRAHDDHPALHVAGEVSGGIKRVVSVNLVLA